MVRSPARRRGFPLGRSSAKDRRFGAHRRARWSNSRKRTFGLRDCRSWWNGSRNWKRRVNPDTAKYTESTEKRMVNTDTKVKTLWRVVVVGGHTRSIGKTQLVCDIIAAFPKADWIAGKITQYGHGVCAQNGEDCDCAPTEHVCALDWEQRFDTGTDSSRFLAAGAKRSFWLRTKQGYLAEGMPLLRQ